jgi:hypothetical protein
VNWHELGDYELLGCNAMLCREVWITIGKNHTVCEGTVLHKIYGDAICMYHYTDYPNLNSDTSLLKILMKSSTYQNNETE